MSGRSFPTVLICVLCALLLAVLWLSKQPVPPAFLPFFSSTLTFFATLFVGFGCVFAACYHLLRGAGWAQAEFDAMAFLKNQMERIKTGEDAFDPRAETIDGSALLGEKSTVRFRYLKTITGQVAASIYRDARLFRYEPVQAILAGHRPQAMSHSATIAIYQTVAVRLGILCTFIGLLTSLGEVQKVFVLRGTVIANGGDATVASGIQSLQNEIGTLIGNIVQGLSLAFGTSIAGITAALIIIGLAGLARRTESRILREMHEVGISLQSFLRARSHGNEAIIKTATELRVAMEAQSRDLIELRKDLSVHALTLSNHAGEISKGLIDPIVQFSQTADGLKALMQQTNSAAQQLQELQKVAQTIELQTIDRLDKVFNRLTESLSADSQLVVHSLRDTHKEMLEANKELSHQTLNSTAALSKELAATINRGLSQEIREAIAEEFSRSRSMDAPRTDASGSSHDGKQARTAFLIYLVAVIGVCVVSVSLMASRQAQSIPVQSQTQQDPGPSDVR